MRSPNRATRNLGKMSATFPKCPICSSEAEYKIKGIIKNTAECLSCRATWVSQDFFGDVELRTLSLEKAGKNRKVKPLQKKQKSVTFWQHFNLDEYDSALDYDVENLLINIYTSRDTDVRENERLKLQDLGEIGLIEVRSIAEGTQPSPNRHIALLYLISLSDETELPIIVKALNANELDFRNTLVDGLVQLVRDDGMVAVIPPVVEVLKHDPDVNLRAHVAWALREVKGNHMVIDALADALQDGESPPMDLITAGSIAGFISAAAKSKPNASVGEIAFHSLAAFGDPRAAEILVMHVLDDPGDVLHERRFVEEIGPLAVEPLIESLTSDNERHRARAAAFLFYVNDERAVDPLIEALTDEKYLVRRNAAFVLGVLGDKRSVEPLKSATKDEDKRVSEPALDALRKIQG